MLFFSCCNNKNITDAEDKTISIKQNSVVSQNKPVKKKMRDYMSDQNYVHWSPKHSGTTGLLCEVTFHEDFILLWIHGQCIYYFFTYKTGDYTADLLWSYKTDCISDMEILEKSHGFKKYPKHRDVFATYTLINDTIINIDYKFPEWTNKINEIEKDSLFPKILYLLN